MRTEKEKFLEIQNDALARYGGRFEKMGVGPRTLGWGCKEDQIERFQTLVQYNDFEGKSILDLGCGFADFYRYLKEQNIHCQYMGVDIIPGFLAYCREEFPEAAFYEGNILLDKEKLPEADCVISLGTLNFKLSNMSNLDYTKAFMNNSFEKAKEKLILDFLSTHLTKDYPEETHVYYHNPADVIAMALNHTLDFQLVHNYKPIPQKEFMIMMEKRHV